MEHLRNTFMSIEQVKGTYLNNLNVNRHSDLKGNTSFEEVLQQVNHQNDSERIVFSKHANERLASRDINLDDEQMTRLNKGILQAKEKNIRETLVMMDNIAFIVNVNKNTVITAMDQSSNESKVFTNIDGAVIV